MSNRNPEQPRKQRKVVVQTPLGVVQLAVGEEAEAALGRALSIFQRAVDQGSGDPLADTLRKLDEMARGGDAGPLHAGLELIRQLSLAGMLPNPEDLLRAAGIQPPASPGVERFTERNECMN